MQSKKATGMLRPLQALYDKAGHSALKEWEFILWSMEQETYNVHKSGYWFSVVYTLLLGLKMEAAE